MNKPYTQQLKEYFDWIRASIKRNGTWPKSIPRPKKTPNLRRKNRHITG